MRLTILIYGEIMGITATTIVTTATTDNRMIISFFDNLSNFILFSPFYYKCMFKTRLLSF
jgi:hypothetical protein